ncbi:MAG: SUMF1/EgtB/PvdO family nonheme iron enzyme [Rhodanobacteraceae bacterium]
MSLSKPVADFEIPGHRLVRPLGKGGMATVYLAIQASLGRPVAVKILQAPTDEAITRFEQEARTIARLQHPHIVAIYEVGRTSDGQLYYSMPYLPNGDLSKMDLRDSPARVAAVLRALLGALAHAHQHGIVHRDVKPENVLFDQHRRALLTDFGIARASESLRVTREGATLGSSGYMSPEQARGMDIDGRSDLYSVGVVAYELLSGDLPFRGADALSTAIAHIEQPVPRLPPMQRAWQPLIDKALAKSLTDRYQNAQEMLDALDVIDGRRGAVTKSSSHKPLLPKPALRAMPPARRRALAFAGSVLALLVVLAAAASVWRSQTRRTMVAQTPPIADARVGVAKSSGAAVAKADVIPPTAAAPASVPTPMPVTASSVAATPSDGAAQVATLLGQGDALFKRGRLAESRGDNAAKSYLAALKLQPDNAQARAGIGKILAALRKNIETAWQSGDADRVRAPVKTIDKLAPSADAAAQTAWHQARAQLAADVGATVAAAAHGGDTKKLAALKPLAKALPATYPAGFDIARLDSVPAVVAPPHAGSPMRDASGPSLVYVPADGNAPAFAIARTDVTRAEYAQFAHATGRGNAPCAEQNNPFSRMHGWNWSNPGFAQSGDHPVVCVSWNDAVAYANWLSRRTGQVYRLPSETEWLRAARGAPGGSPCARGNVDDTSRQSKLDNDRWPCSDGAAQTSPVGRYVQSTLGAYDMYGNVSQWVSGAGAFRGLSWRDGSHETALGRRGSVAPDLGYTNIGFRVVRVIDARHPPPA